VGPRRLYLLVSTSLRASWIYRYQDNGKKHDHGLGPYPDVSLADARKARLKCDGLRRDGIDPIAARKAARAKAKLDTAKAMTFKDCAAAYIKAHMAGWRTRSMQRNGRTRSRPTSIPSSDRSRCKTSMYGS
jgi:hypothetical protein